MIQSQATTAELDSPFYLQNEARCKDFEAIIANLGGQCVGGYNSWSYNVKAKICNHHLWVFQIKKASQVSGNLLLSSAYQNNFVSATWTCKRLDLDLPDFTIERRKVLSGFKPVFNRNIQVLDKNPSYILKSLNPCHPLLEILYEDLKDIFDRKEVYEITFHNQELIIELRTERLYPDLIKVLSLSNFEMKLAPESVLD